MAPASSKPPFGVVKLDIDDSRVAECSSRVRMVERGILNIMHVFIDVDGHDFHVVELGRDI